MEGEREGPQRGIIPRAVEDIFTCIESDTATGSKYLVRASYLQIYNEVRQKNQEHESAFAGAKAVSDSLQTLGCTESLRVHDEAFPLDRLLDNHG